MFGMIMTAIKGLFKIFSFGKSIKKDVEAKKINTAKAENKALKVENKILRSAAANPERVKEIKKMIYKKKGDNISINFDDLRGT